ncbi:MAG: FAD-dependent oxidoreductase, partial [Kiritimatiellae bacterium]|nr:FAD-dependent oxidoreductase [Verrucomicrobiota bacterium]MCG2660230.1 FAD-dependent oxidoreductase [Kiritimatiellia bacterium]
IEGFNSPEHPCRQIQVPLYSIPLRALFSRNIANLFFAGRNISASHIAFASTRVMATCALMGQAVGTAAAICRAKKIVPRQAAQSAIGLIQQRLLADDCFLLGKKNADADDLACKAMVSAGSFKPGCGPEKVIDGVARPSLDDEHCWESAPLTESEAWLALTWPQPVTIRKLQLTFDSELEKRLIFSQDDSIYTDPLTLNAMPGRLAKHFELQTCTASGWEPVRVVADNRQRVRRELFDPPLVTAAIRLRCKATCGYPAARLFEIRAYA